MSPQVRRVSLLAGVAGLSALAAVAFAAAPETGEAKAERQVVIIKEGPDGREVRLEGEEALRALETMDIDVQIDPAELAELEGLGERIAQRVRVAMPRIRALHHPMMMPMEPAERADHLRDMLQLRPDQERALKAFIDATAGKPAFEPADFEGEEDLTTPQRLERMRKEMAEHQAAFERRAQAVGRFYGQLSPTQKKVFDKMPHMDGMGMRHDVRAFRRAPPLAPVPPAPPKLPG